MGGRDQRFGTENGPVALRQRAGMPLGQDRDLHQWKLCICTIGAPLEDSGGQDPAPPIKKRIPEVGRSPYGGHPPTATHVRQFRSGRKQLPCPGRKPPLVLGRDGCPERQNKEPAGSADI